MGEENMPPEKRIEHLLKISEESIGRYQRWSDIAKLFVVNSYLEGSIAKYNTKYQEAFRNGDFVKASKYLKKCEKLSDRADQVLEKIRTELYK